MQNDDTQRGKEASEDRNTAMTGGAAQKEKTKPSPSGEEAMPGAPPATPTTPG